MRISNLTEIKQLALNAKYAIWDKANSLARDPKVYLHWSAGKYRSYFEDYHININDLGEIYIATTDFSEVLNHTYMRNSASLGISLACAYGATSNNLGDYPPTQAQIEAMSQIICVVCKAWDLTIDKQRVMTHGEAADNEDGWDLYYNDYNGQPNNMYGPKHGCERWDLEFLGTSESPKYNPYATDGSRGGDVLRGKANWYNAQNLFDKL